MTNWLVLLISPVSFGAHIFHTFKHKEYNINVSFTKHELLWAENMISILYPNIFKFIFYHSIFCILMDLLTKNYLEISQVCFNMFTILMGSNIYKLYLFWKNLVLLGTKWITQHHLAQPHYEHIDISLCWYNQELDSTQLRISSCYMTI